MIEQKKKVIYFTLNIYRYMVYLIHELFIVSWQFIFNWAAKICCFRIFNYLGFFFFFMSKLMAAGVNTLLSHGTVNVQLLATLEQNQELKQEHAPTLHQHTVVKIVPEICLLQKFDNVNWGNVQVSWVFFWELTKNNMNFKSIPCIIKHCYWWSIFAFWFSIEVDGGLSEYSLITWGGECSTTCDFGTESGVKTRTCTNPAPAYGGKDCAGELSTTESRQCKLRECPSKVIS